MPQGPRSTGFATPDRFCGRHRLILAGPALGAKIAAFQTRSCALPRLTRPCRSLQEGLPKQGPTSKPWQRVVPQLRPKRQYAGHRLAHTPPSSGSSARAAAERSGIPSPQSEAPNRRHASFTRLGQANFAPCQTKTKMKITVAWHAQTILLFRSPWRHASPPLAEK